MGGTRTARGRQFGNGPWEGGSRLYGDAKVKSWSAKLTDSGPVFARVEVRYTLADGATVAVSGALAAGDNAVRWDLDSKADVPSAGVEFTIGKVPGLTEGVVPKDWGQWATRERKLPVKPRCRALLHARPQVQRPDLLSGKRLGGPHGGFGGGTGPAHAGGGALGGSGEALHLRRVQELEPGDDFQESWEHWRRKRLAVAYATDGALGVKANLASGVKCWSVSGGLPAVGDRLNVVKDYILEWPESPAVAHPRLFTDLKELKEKWAQAASNPEIEKTMNSGQVANARLALWITRKPADQQTQEEKKQAVEQLRGQLARLGDFDVMRGAIATAATYDSVIANGWLTPPDKALFRAQMAYLGYVMAEPRTWSAERGYHSGNPNMSVSYILSLGVIACALPDHPMAEAWSDYATGSMKTWLENEVGPNGEWIPEGSHYGYVSLEPMVSLPCRLRRTSGSRP